MAEREIVRLQDENGVAFTAEVMTYFTYDDQEYALLINHGKVEGADCEFCIYRADINYETFAVEYLPVATEKSDGVMAKATSYVQAILDEENEVDSTEQADGEHHWTNEEFQAFAAELWEEHLSDYPEDVVEEYGVSVLDW